MGLITWIAIAVIVLAVIGLGIGVFFSGLIRGAEIIGNSPAVQNVTEEAKEFLKGNMQLGSSSSSNVLAITTNKAIYSIGEPVLITVKNIGKEVLTFSDSALGLQIQNTNTGQTYHVIAAQVLTDLEPEASKTITWNQEDGNGNNVPAGGYTATVQQQVMTSSSSSSSSSQNVSAQVSFEIRG
jgi:flagellar hook assembly protein FlgD